VATIVPLGKLADLAGAPKLALPLSLAAELDWQGLKSALPPLLADALEDPKVRIAVNGALVPNKHKLQANAGDEIALLPPVSGG
jgi:molybdopterin synthase sulfur carrier subunit